MKIHKLKAWLGHVSWSKHPLTVCRPGENQYSTIFETKKDALNAGWNKPKRVEIIIKVKP